RPQSGRPLRPAPPQSTVGRLSEAAPLRRLDAHPCDLLLASARISSEPSGLWLRRPNLFASRRGFHRRAVVRDGRFRPGSGKRNLAETWTGYHRIAARTPTEPCECSSSRITKGWPTRSPAACAAREWLSMWRSTAPLPSTESPPPTTT